MQRLTSKIAWVTGAGSGIGEAGALALAEEGASVMLTGRRREPLEAVAARIAKQGGTARVHPGEMSRSEDASAIAEAIEKEFARLDILVNNAGSNIPDRSWKRLSRPASRILSGRTCRAHSMARSRRCRSCASRRTV
jgi:NADP-dependent 3-hydroxy acid dehydrogenase YdfG